MANREGALLNTDLRRIHWPHFVLSFQLHVTYSTQTRPYPAPIRQLRRKMWLNFASILNSTVYRDLGAIQRQERSHALRRAEG